jgi:hypothetical protein
MVPVRLALRVTGDLATGFTIALRYRLLGLVTGTRVVRTPGAPATTAPGHGKVVASATPSGPVPARDAAEEPPASPPAPDRRSRSLADRTRLVERVLRKKAVRIERPHGRVEFALGDPGETGRAYGFACALATLADPHRAVALAPSWTGEDWLAVDLALDLRVVPLRLAVIVALERHHRAA